jgi:hypothetical protein
MLAAERPQPQSRSAHGRSARPGRTAEGGMSQQDGNGRSCEVRMMR